MSEDLLGVGVFECPDHDTMIRATDHCVKHNASSTKQASSRPRTAAYIAGRTDKYSAADVTAVVTKARKIARLGSVSAARASAAIASARQWTAVVEHLLGQQCLLQRDLMAAFAGEAGQLDGNGPEDVDRHRVCYAWFTPSCPGSGGPTRTEQNPPANSWWICAMTLSPIRSASATVVSGCAAI